MPYDFVIISTKDAMNMTSAKPMMIASRMIRELCVMTIVSVVVSFALSFQK